MAGLILCRSEEAKNPYYFHSVGVNIYSLEELCYAVYNNIYMLDANFTDSELIRFIKEETKDTWLSNELTFLNEKKAGLREKVITILLYVDYYSKKQIDDIRMLIDSLNSLGNEERLKYRGDNFLNNNMYESAINSYMDIFNATEHNMGDSFYGNVFHNTAVAYAKLFFFDNAAICFKNAYQLNSNEESLRQYYMAMELAGKNVLAESKLYNEELQRTCKEQLDESTKRILECKEYKKVSQIADLKTQGRIEEYNEQLLELFNSWKADYSAYMR